MPLVANVTAGIHEYSDFRNNNDEFIFAAGTNLNNVTFSRVNNNDLRIVVTGTGALTATYTGYFEGDEIENLYVADQAGTLPSRIISDDYRIQYELTTAGSPYQFSIAEESFKYDITVASGATVDVTGLYQDYHNLILNMPVYYRTYGNNPDINATLQIKDDNKTINITGYNNFNKLPNFLINGATPQSCALNVTASADYTCSSAFQETILIDGDISVANINPMNHSILFATGTNTKYSLTDEGYTIEDTLDPSKKVSLDSVVAAKIGTFTASTTDTLSGNGGKTLYVSNLTNFDGSNNTFKNYDITGTVASDTLTGSSENDTICGGDGNDIIYGKDGIDVIYGGDGNDTIYTGNGDDIVDGGDGNDTIYIDGYGSKTVYGREGNNTYYLDKGSVVIKDAHAGDTIYFATFDFSKIEFARGEGDNANDLLIKSRVENDSDIVVINNYFGLSENERISTFNVQGTEYTLEWRKSNFKYFSEGMYNVITNDNPNFADGIRNWISGDNGEGVEIKGRDDYDKLMGTSHNDTISAGIKGGELYGNAGNDKLYGSTEYDYIVGGSENDEIYLGNTYSDNDTILFINPDGANTAEKLAFGKDTVYNANLFDDLRFVYDTGEGFIGYKPSDLTFEKSGTSLIIKDKATGENEVKLVNYFNKNGKVQKNAPYRLTLLNGDTQPSSYYIEALGNPNTLDLTDYEYNELTFERNITGNNINDLVIKKGNDVIETLTNFFKQKNPIDWVLTKDDTISIKDDVDIQVITGNKDYTGTDYSETVTSSSSNEKYNLKTNEDEIIFSGSFGQDTITVNDNQSLELIFNKDNINWSVSGKDVILKDGENNQVTIKNYAAKEYKNTDIHIKANSYEYSKNLKYVDFNPKVDGNKVTGTRLNETYTSKAADEIIDLKTGDDYVYYDIQDVNGSLIGWGNDRITVNKNEELSIDIIYDYVVTKNATDYTYEVQNNLEIKGKDLIITSTAVCDTPPEGYNRKYDLGTITLIGGANIDSSTVIWLNDENLSGSYINYETGEITAALNYNENDVSKKGAINGTQLSDYINLTNYMSEKGKGVNINTKGGEDIVMGSKYNDTIKSMSGSNRIEEYAGNNIITTGSGDDEIVADGTSSNTINAGEGRNWVWLNSSGTNKLTVGNSTNFITVTNGNNTIKAGNGGSLVKLQGGKNTVTTGKGRDDIIISDPYLTGAQSVNVIKTGTGADTIQIDAMSENTINTGDGGKNQYGETIGNKIIINNGINTVTSGKNADKITITSGQNIINSGAGDDIFTISGGTSILDGSTGNDIYNVDITTFNNNLIINDTKGTNILNLGTANNNQVNIFFDVALNKKGKAVFGEMKFSTDNVVGTDGFNGLNGIDVANKKVISKLEYGEAGTYKSFDIKSTEIDKLAADIAGWLKSNPAAYSSTADVYASGNAGDITKLTAAYTNFANNGYVYNNANSLMN